MLSLESATGSQGHDVSRKAFGGRPYRPVARRNDLGAEPILPASKSNSGTCFLTRRRHILSMPTRDKSFHKCRWKYCRVCRGSTGQLNPTASERCVIYPFRGVGAQEIGSGAIK